MKRILILMSLCPLLLHTSCASKQGENEEKANFLVTSPLRMDTVITKDYVCQIRSISHIELRAQERGYLEKIYVDEGQFVKKGTLLFQIMPKLYDAEVKKSEAEANFADIEYRNTLALTESKVVSPNELAMAKAKLDKANAELTLSQVHLQFTEIRAPFDGIVGRFMVRLGSLVDEGDLLTNLSDNSKMWVYFNVPEGEYLDYKLNSTSDTLLKVNLMMANNQRFGFQGVVETIEADFNNETGNIAFRATFPNPNKLLRHGETGNIEMVVPLKDVLIIPQKATFEILEKKYVFLVDKNNVVKQTEIHISAEMPDLYIIKDKFTDKDKILLEGIRKVTDGQKIEYTYEDPHKVLKNLKVYVE